MSPDSRELNVAILLFPDVEELDFVGPFEVFAVASRPEISGEDAPWRIRVFTVAEHPGPVKGRGGLAVLPDYSLDNCPQVDLLVVPGGLGTRREVDNSRLVDWIRRTSEGALLSSSVCTGAFLLAKAGLLEGREVTTHWASLERMSETFPSCRVRSDLRVVDAGPIVTSAGISAGIDMALHLVARLQGLEVAHRTARQMEYTWSESQSS
jgi:transcriptional regulator GlxA family with amidase domain